MLLADDTHGRVRGEDEFRRHFLRLSSSLCVTSAALRFKVCCVRFFLRCWLLSEASQSSFKVTLSKELEPRLHVDGRPNSPFIYFPTFHDEPPGFFFWFIQISFQTFLVESDILRHSFVSGSHLESPKFRRFLLLLHSLNVKRLKGRDRKESAPEGKTAIKQIVLSFFQQMYMFAYKKYSFYRNAKCRTMPFYCLV